MVKIYILREGEEYECFYDVKAYHSEFSAEMAAKIAAQEHEKDCKADDITPYKIYIVTPLELED